MSSEQAAQALIAAAPEEQFSAGAPKLDDVITTKILDATKDARPKLG